MAFPNGAAQKVRDRILEVAVVSLIGVQAFVAQQVWVMNGRLSAIEAVLISTDSRVQLAERIKALEGYRERADERAVALTERMNRLEKHLDAVSAEVKEHH